MNNLLIKVCLVISMILSQFTHNQFQDGQSSCMVSNLRPVDEPKSLGRFILSSTHVRFSFACDPCRIIEDLRSIIPRPDTIVKTSSFKIKMSCEDYSYKLQLFKDEDGYIVEYRKIRGCHFKLAAIKTHLLRFLNRLSIQPV